MQQSLSQIVAELQRRLANIVRRGKVHSVQLQPPRVRVEFTKGLVTGWLHWVHGRAGNRRDWEPLTIGELVTVISESGELNNGVVIPGLLTDSNPAPSSNEDEHVVQYEDGTRTVYDRKAHKLTVTIAGGNAELNCDTFIINADIQHSGNQITSGEIVAGGVFDSVRSMQQDRNIYNSHDHPDAGTVNQKQ